jgi:membrane protease YdiL (CAAX protease family)
MKKLTDWIKHRQVASFFIIAFALCWGLGFSWNAVQNQNHYFLLPVAFIAACGPGLAGMIISAIINTQPKQGSRKAFWIVFLVAWFVATVVYLANSRFIEQSPLSPAAIDLFTVSVVPVAFVIASTHSRIPAVRRYLSSLIQLRGVVGWSLLALVLLPALLVIAHLINSLINRQPMPSGQLQDINLVLIGLVIVKLLYVLFFFVATGEETGLRGFALPRLQARTNPLISSVVIAFFWTPLHIFWWHAEGRPVMSVGFLLEMFIAHTLFSIVIVWMCNRAKGSILVAGLTHAAANTAQSILQIPSTLLIMTFSLAALLAIITDRMWRRLPPAHPAVYRSSDHTAQQAVAADDLSMRA